MSRPRLQLPFVDKKKRTYRCSECAREALRLMKLHPGDIEELLNMPVKVIDESGSVSYMDKDEFEELFGGECDKH